MRKKNSQGVKVRELMEEMKVSLSEASLMVICLDQFCEHDWSGRLYIRSRVEPWHFHGALELLGVMEQFYDWIDYPQASLSSRSFCPDSGRKTSDGKKSSIRRTNRKGEQSVVVSEKKMRENRGEKATFLVRVQYRQRATWQGQVTWAEKNKTISFRSALELLKLIDSVENSDKIDFESFCKTEENQEEN